MSCPEASQLDTEDTGVERRFFGVAPDVLIEDSKTETIENCSIFNF